MQITDNGLSRDLFPADYHCLGDNENRPIKWLSFESLTAKTFSTASDVVCFYLISEFYDLIEFSSGLLVSFSGN